MQHFKIVNNLYISIFKNSVPKKAHTYYLLEDNRHCHPVLNRQEEAPFFIQFVLNTALCLRYEINPLQTALYIWAAT